MKEILYLSTLCSDKKYAHILKTHEIGMQVNKFDKLIAKGFNANTKTQILSVLNLVEPDKSDEDFIFECENGIDYVYPNIKSTGVFKYISLFLKTYKYARRFLKNDNGYIVLNLMCMTGCLAAIMAASSASKKCVGILTDIPQHLMIGDGLKAKIKCFIHSFIINRCGHYVFLTDAMKDKVKMKNKSYIVVEGSVDSELVDKENALGNKYEKKVCHYAGMLHEKYGVSIMVDGFIKADIEDSELHIYGNGEYKEKLVKLCMKHDNIIYHGIKLNDYVVAEQIKSTLLINPRTSEGEYTKYSFPSKNMEYMACATPALLCDLPGMPSEYSDYVYVLKDETIDGMCEKLKEILSLDRSELHKKGKKAKEFVMSKKSNVVQTKRILDFIETI